MKKLALALIVVALGLSPAFAAPAKPSDASLPLVIAFADRVDDETPSDSEVVVTVIERLRSVAKVDVLAFSPELPSVTRAMMESRLDQQTLSQTSDPAKALRVAAAMGAQYALNITGIVDGPKVRVILNFTRVADGECWSTAGGSDIQEDNGPRESLNRTNAIVAAVSSAVSQVVIGAFGQDVLLDTPAPEKPTETPVPAISPAPDAIPAADNTTPVPEAGSEPVRDTTAEYTRIMRAVEASKSKNDLAGAVVEIRKAINLEPDNAAPRIQLVEMYVELGMTADAIDECKRALLFAGDNLELHNMLAQLYLANGAIEDATAVCEKIIALDPKNIETRISLGDLYWNQHRLDEAERMYKEAAETAESDPAPRERLQRLYSARKIYPEALKQLLQARTLAANVSDENARYEVTARVVQDEFTAVLGKLDAARSDYDRSRITRDDFYKECKDATSRIDALAGYLSTQTAPDGYKDAHPHGALAVSLLAQASGYCVSYLETEKPYYMEQADLLRSESETELGVYLTAIRKTGELPQVESGSEQASGRDAP